jgi:5'-3' exonuclease
MAATPTLLALDGNSLFHRAYHGYAHTNLTNAAGQPVYAIHGFLALLNGVLEIAGADAVVIAFDDPDRNERKVRWPQYKAQRSEKDDALVDQMVRLMAVLGDAGMPVVIEPGWEADDVVASVALLADARGWHTVIATSDRDAFSLITDTTSVLRLGNKLDNAVTLTPQLLVDTFGITPAQYLDYAALRGDTSDNLPGVKGIGEKTAAALLQEFGTVEAALADIERVIAVLKPAAARNLLAGRDAWELNRQIMDQRRDLPVNLDGRMLDELDLTALAAALHAAELPNMVSRFTATLQGGRRQDRRSRGQIAGQPDAPPPLGNTVRPRTAAPARVDAAPAAPAAAGLDADIRNPRTVTVGSLTLSVVGGPGVTAWPVTAF